MELHSSYEGRHWAGQNSMHIHPGKATEMTHLTGIKQTHANTMTHALR